MIIKMEEIKVFDEFIESLKIEDNQMRYNLFNLFRRYKKR